jgi:ribonuclease R
VRVVRQDRRGRPEGRVLEIVERPPQPIIGRLLNEGGIWLVAPEDKRYGQDVLIPKAAIGAAKPGQVVVVELTEPPALYGQPVGRVKEVLGEIDDPGMEIEIAVRKYGVPHEFSDAAIGEARALPDSVRPRPAGRVDLTDVPLVTIDGEDARDFDDAVYCQPAVVTGRGKKPNGWRLLVAIADVSHYVRRPAADRRGRLRPRHQRVLSAPRHPHAAREAQQRPVLAQPRGRAPVHGVRHAGHGQGEVHAYQFYPAVMFSHARFTYTEVAAILANTRGPEASARKERVQGPAEPARRVPRPAEGARRRAARWISTPPRRRSSATRPAASKRSCRAPATTRTA